MELPDGLESLFVIVLVAGLAPLIVAALPGPRLPEVVVLLVLGVVIGPDVLGWASTEDAILLIANVGLGMLFFLAGFELDLSTLKGRGGRLAITAWCIAILVAMAVVGLLEMTGYVKAFLPVSIALTTTALGTLLPILADSGENTGPLGRAILANGAVGEFFPIVAISLFLSARGAWISLALLVGFGAVAVLVSRIVKHLSGRQIASIVRMGSDTSSQTTVRATVLLMVALLLLSGELGLDMVLGAFAAGIVLRVTLPKGDPILERKLEGLAFGFFVPIFFIVSGMRIDIDSIIEDPGRLMIFFVLILLVRGGTVALVHRSLGGMSAVRLGLYSATALPLIVALTEIGLATGEMRPENAAALVGAGLLTVLVLPMTARLLGGKGSPPAAEREPVPVPEAGSRG